MVSILIAIVFKTVNNPILRLALADSDSEDESDEGSDDCIYMPTPQLLRDFSSESDSDGITTPLSSALSSLSLSHSNASQKPHPGLVYRLPPSLQSHGSPSTPPSSYAQRVPIPPQPHSLAGQNSAPHRDDRGSAKKPNPSDRRAPFRSYGNDDGCLGGFW